jgi:hypothetical protein
LTSGAASWPSVIRCFWSRTAYGELATAQAGGVSVATIAPLRTRLEHGLNILYSAEHAKANPVVRFGSGAQPAALSRGPTSDSNALYYIDASAGTVSRVDPTVRQPTSTVVVRTGDADPSGADIAKPKFLSVGGLDLLIVDERGDLWRWLPSDHQGSGTLRKVLVGGDVIWGSNVTGITTYPPGNQTYAIYVSMPTQNQILKYQAFADGSGLQTGARWLTTDRQDVGSFMDMTINYNLYAILAAAGSCDTSCVGDQVLEFTGGNYQSNWKLGLPPDDGDLRPGHDYRHIDTTGDQSSGGIYLYDAKNQRVVVFTKDGKYDEQWLAAVGGPQMSDVAGMVVEDRTSDNGNGQVFLDWITPSGLYRSPLTDIGDAPQLTPAPNESPTAGPVASPTKKPHKSPKPTH